MNPFNALNCEFHPKTQIFTIVIAHLFLIIKQLFHEIHKEIEDSFILFRELMYTV